MYVFVCNALSSYKIKQKMTQICIHFYVICVNRIFLYCITPSLAIFITHIIHTLYSSQSLNILFLYNIFYIQCLLIYSKVFQLKIVQFLIHNMIYAPPPHEKTKELPIRLTFECLNYYEDNSSRYSQNRFWIFCRETAIAKLFSF